MTPLPLLQEPVSRPPPNTITHITDSQRAGQRAVGARTGDDPVLLIPHPVRRIRNLEGIHARARLFQPEQG